MQLNKVTVRKQDIIMRPCKACGTNTAHIGKEDAQPHAMLGKSVVFRNRTGSTCLQCLVDGGNSSDNFTEWSRWIDPKTGKQLVEPRGYLAPKTKPEVSTT